MSLDKLRTLQRDLRHYARGDADGGVAELFLALAEEGEAAFRRQRLEGHFTGSAWLVSADGERALLMHHRKLDRWLQPGGHADGDVDLAAVALREATEETGLPGLRVQGGIFDLDRHRIPARGNEPEHWHYDVRYVVRAGAVEDAPGNAESLALAWKPVATLAEDPQLDDSLRRMARKWIGRPEAVRA